MLAPSTRGQHRESGWRLGDGEMTLIFVRHGESEANALGVYAGWADYDLTDRGRAEAGAVARRLADAGAVALYSSPLIRARHTADALASSTGLAVEEVLDLREYTFGDAERMKREDVLARWGPSSAERRVPGEEGWEPFRERVERSFDALFDRHRDDLAICVSHGGWLLRVASYIWGLGPRDGVRTTTTNCAVTVVEAIDGAHVVTVWNDACHLVAVEAGEGR